MSLLQSWLRDMRSQSTGQVPRIECDDGLVMSVQASSMHYCTPRDNVGPWTHVEIGYPSRVIPELAQYGEQGYSSVYAYVPIELVENIIEASGGMGSS